MLNIHEVKQLLGDDTVSDEEAGALRAACYELAAIILEQWKSQLQRGEPQDN